jgi:AcrR family transcriptional regulator
VGVDLIGERAGMSGPAIYRYFTSKDEILMTLIDEAVDQVLIATGGKFDDPRDEIKHMARGHVQRVLEQRELMGVWTRERKSIPSQHRARVSARINRYVQRWVDCLQACYPDQDVDVLRAATHATHGLIDSVALWPPQALKVEGLDILLSEMALTALQALDRAGRSGAVSKRRTKPPERSTA